MTHVKAVIDDFLNVSLETSLGVETALSAGSGAALASFLREADTDYSRAEHFY